MGVEKYDIKELEFDRSNSEQYELSILLGMGSFTYIVREKRSLRLLVYRSLSLQVSNIGEWNQRMQKVVQEDEVLRPSLIKNVQVGWITHRATLVPGRLYQEGRAAEYLGQLTTIGLQDRCFNTALPAMGAQLVYAVGQDRVDGVTRRFAPVSSQHYAKGLLQNWQEQNRGVGHRAIYAGIRDGQMVLAGIDAGKVIFFNVFAFSTAQDALYYVSLAFQQCGWGLDRVPLYLCGEIVVQSEVYRQLYRFVEDIRFIGADLSKGIPGVLLSQLPPHLYHDLICQF
ncbi:hypothetical protein CEQ90_14290 [Lewinellaceae bacterium SD302]|nr:hypothetical protein CEQ90_14290 [Lewinellaceae bacterium SD302]